MVVKQNELGSIEISPTAIAGLVSHAAALTYGIAGMAQPHRARQVAATLIREPYRGVTVQCDAEDSLTIDVYVVINYGMNLVSVANNLISNIRYHVETHTNTPVKQVNIHVQGLRMPPPRDLG